MATKTETTTRLELDPWDQEGYLGSIDVARVGESVPAVAAHVIRSGSHLLYRKSVVTRGGASWFEPAHFAGTDRKRALAIIRDDAPERQEALRQALLADRWQHAIVAGSLDVQADWVWPGHLPE